MKIKPESKAAENQLSQFAKLPKLKSRTNQIYKLPSCKNDKIIINISNTNYQVIEDVARSPEFNWKIQFADSNNWNIKWIDSGITSQRVMRMNLHQRINHFPGMSCLSRKNNLALQLNKMKTHFGDAYDFFPKTFLLPHDTQKLKKAYKNKSPQQAFIIKPQANCQGRGIYLAIGVRNIDLEEKCVVQEYLSQPLLYKSLKFDLRIYALVTSCDPLKIYIYNEGLVRFATEQYSKPSPENIDDLCIHLTNYAINKQNPKYIFNQTLSDLSYGHKKSLAQFFKQIKLMGFPALQYWASIKDIVVKTLIAGQPALKRQYRYAQPNYFANNMCFEILGFDFMIGQNNKCYLVQVNHSPSFSTGTPLDQLVKSNLIKDTLHILNIPNSRHKAQALVSYAKNNLKRKKIDFQTQLIMRHQLKVEQESENKYLGNYCPIFPSKFAYKQCLYEEMMEWANSQQDSGILIESPKLSLPRSKYKNAHVNTSGSQKDKNKQELVTRKSIGESFHRISMLGESSHVKPTTIRTQGYYEQLKKDKARSISRTTAQEIIQKKLKKYKNFLMS